MTATDQPTVPAHLSPRLAAVERMLAEVQELKKGVVTPTLRVQRGLPDSAEDAYRALTRIGGGLYDLRRLIQEEEGIRRNPELDWYTGPTSTDPAPWKRWHVDCGGQVEVVEDADLCARCWSRAGS